MEENTLDAVVNAPGAIFGITTFNEVAERQELERAEKAASSDDDFDEDDPDQLVRRIREDDALDGRARTTGVEHMTPDNDPYGWIAGVEAAHSDFVQPEPKLEPEHVMVWQHAMIEPQRFDHAVAKVLPNGTLLITRPGSDVPLKGYAPGVWVTFEHIGERYHVRPQQRREVEVRPRKGGTVVRVTNYAEREKGAVDEMTPLARAINNDLNRLADPTRRTPPTFESDADDTQNIQVVKAAEADGEGGGVVRPFGRGVRPDAAHVVHPVGRRTDGPEDDAKRPGWFRSLWESLKNPDWSED